tara:strand:- start:1443 stop:2030 length:588 start_codon:yes stop_codon:yes gene_type:complete
MKKFTRWNKDTLTFDSIPTKMYLKIIGLTIVGLGLLFTIGYYSGTNNYVINKLTHTTEVTDTLVVHGKPFNEDALVSLLKSCNVKYPYIVLAQAKVESGNYTSSIFRHNHNLFGMRLAKQRITTAESDLNGFAYYRDWVDGVHDYAMYQASVMCNVSNEAEYFAKLEARYAQDSSYVSILKDIIAKEKLKSLFEE